VQAQASIIQNRFKIGSIRTKTKPSQHMDTEGILGVGVVPRHRKVI